MKRLNVAVLTVSLLLAVLLGGCATTHYQQPIDDLAAAVEESVSLIEDMDDQMTARRNQQWAEGIQKGELLVTYPDEACAIDSTECYLQVESRSGVLGRYPATSVMPRGRLALRSLAVYVEQLQAIANADTEEDVVASVNATLGNLETIDSRICELGRQTSCSSSLNDYSAPVFGSVKWLVRNYVAYARQRALAEVTRRAQPTIERLALYYDTMSEAAAKPALAAGADRFVDAEQDFDDEMPPSAAVLERYANAVAAYDAILKAHAAKPLARFVETHNTLQQQLNGEGDVGVVDVLAAIDRMQSETVEFRAIMSQFKDAVE